MSAAESAVRKMQGTMSPNQVKRKILTWEVLAGRRQLKSAAMGAQPAIPEKTIPYQC